MLPSNIGFGVIISASLIICSGEASAERNAADNNDSEAAEQGLSGFNTTAKANPRARWNGPVLDIYKKTSALPSSDVAVSSDIIYSIIVRNVGSRSPGSNSVMIIDQLPRTLIFFNGNIDADEAGSYGLGSYPGDHPITFADKASGLSFDFVQDAAFSDQAAMPSSFADCDYVPTPGYDPAVRHICLNPKGIFAVGNPISEITFYLRAKSRSPQSTDVASISPK